MTLDDSAATVSILNPTGGLVGGDRLSIDVTVGPDAHAILTTPSATKVYRTAGDPTVQEVTLRLDAGATLEWIPDHTIPFAGSAFAQTIDADVGDDASLIVVDAFAAGRIARGEAWRFTLLESALTIHDAKGWLLYDRLRLRGGERWDGLGFAERHPYFVSVAVIGGAPGDDRAREVTSAAASLVNARVGVARLPRRGLLVRGLAGTAPDLTEAVEALWAAARGALLGRSPLSLRKL